MCTVLEKYLETPENTFMSSRRLRAVSESLYKAFFYYILSSETEEKHIEFSLLMLSGYLGENKTDLSF